MELAHFGSKILAATIAVGFFALVHVGHADAAPQKRMTSRNPASSAVPKELWAAQVKVQFIADFCQKPNKGYLKCFDGSKMHCRAAVNDALDDCVTQVEVPETLTKGQGQSFEKRLTRCLTEAVREKSKPKLSQAASCSTSS